MGEVITTATLLSIIRDLERRIAELERRSAR
jgi:hypothetical protein